MLHGQRHLQPHCDALESAKLTMFCVGSLLLLCLIALTETGFCFLCYYFDMPRWTAYNLSSRSHLGPAELFPLQHDPEVAALHADIGRFSWHASRLH